MDKKKDKDPNLAAYILQYFGKIEFSEMLFLTHYSTDHQNTI